MVLHQESVMVLYQGECQTFVSGEGQTVVSGEGQGVVSGQKGQYRGTTRGGLKISHNQRIVNTQHSPQRRGSTFHATRGMLAHGNIRLTKNTAKRNMSSAVCASSMCKSLAPTPIYM